MVCEEWIWKGDSGCVRWGVVFEVNWDFKFVLCGDKGFDEGWWVSCGDSFVIWWCEVCSWVKLGKRVKVFWCWFKDIE